MSEIMDIGWKGWMQSGSKKMNDEEEMTFLDWIFLALRAVLSYFNSFQRIFVSQEKISEPDVHCIKNVF